MHSRICLLLGGRIRCVQINSVAIGVSFPLRQGFPDSGSVLAAAWLGHTAQLLCNPPPSNLREEQGKGRVHLTGKQ